MSMPDTTEDFTAASADPKAGSARWARRLPVRLPLRIPLRRRRSAETAPLEPESSHTDAAPAPRTGGRLEATHRLAGFDLRSVASTALLYYACVLVVLTLGVILLWGVANMLGVVGRVEEFMRSIGFRGFHFAGFQIIVGGVLLAVAAVAFLTVMTVLAAAFYNLLGRPDRGVKLSLAAIEPVSTAEEPPVADNNGHSNGNGRANGSSSRNGDASANGDGSVDERQITRVRRSARLRSLVGRKRAE
jgi:transmembrane protein DUF3566